MITRRDCLVLGAGMAAGAALSTWVSPERRAARQTASTADGSDKGGTASPASPTSQEEYVWISCNAHLPLFVAHDHPALELAARELGVKVRIEGPDTVDFPAQVKLVEIVAAQRPAGIMVVGWDPSSLIPAINAAVDAGIPVICVDADVPESKRLAFVGTDWRDLGKQQALAMLKALNGRKGEVAMLGLLNQFIDQEAFAGFRSVAEPAGLTVLNPFEDKGNIPEATRVASSLLQAYPNLVGMAGFDSESGPGMGQAIREAGRNGQIVATCVEAEPQHLQLLKQNALTACIGQKRELFTYMGVIALYHQVHGTIAFSKNDQAAKVSRIPVNYNTGTYTVTAENVDLFLKS